MAWTSTKLIECEDCGELVESRSRIRILCRSCSDKRRGNTGERAHWTGNAKSTVQKRIARYREPVKPYNRLFAAILISAINDMRHNKSRAAYNWLLNDGPLYVEALGLNIDIRKWAEKEYNRVLQIS